MRKQTRLAWVGSLLLLGCGSSTHGTPVGDAGIDATRGTDSGHPTKKNKDSGTDGGADAGADGHTVKMPDAAADADGGGTCSSTMNNCFASPGACCFPDPKYDNVGVPSGAKLTTSGSVTVTTPKTLLKNLDVTGQIAINANDTTLQFVRLTVTDTGSGTASINIGSGVTGTVIEDSTIQGSGANPAPESAIFNHYGAPLTLMRVYIHNFADPIEGPVTLSDSYIDSNGTYGSGSSIAHIEDIYVSDDTVTVNHSVLFNPSSQTATVFMDTSGSGSISGDDHLTITGSLLAGGGWTLYPSAKSTSVGSGTMNVSNNRFARCSTKPVFDGSGTTCAGGADTHGYYPGCGYYGLAADLYCPPTAGQTWTGNVWDDDGTTVKCP